MLNIEIDGRAVQVPNGSTVMDAANKLGIYVPHFCYHKKLSIAANCRMCLVQVEKAPKPLPACATPVTDGMKALTHSEQATKAQKSVMEFLLINHPLDCPICDQGGECQLQDLAVGYGDSASRYHEPKRVVFHKNLGPLISAEEMTRCIHCTRCVRFGQEIAGVMELGMIGRGEHAEIVTFVGKTVDSELSGNMIDLCPVGALTSKPFRYAARTWELSRRKSVSPHDGLGSNLVVQVKNDRVMRVLPLENEAINECWLSDKDRFSYEGLNADGPADRADGEAGRRMDDGRLADGARIRRAAGSADIVAKHGAPATGRAGVAACDARGARARGAAHARARQRQRRLPPAPGRLPRRRRARGHPVAGHADRRRRVARPRAGRRQLPAQGPPADRAAPAAGRQEAHRGLVRSARSTTTGCCRSGTRRSSRRRRCPACSRRSSSQPRRRPASRSPRRSPASSRLRRRSRSPTSLLAGKKGAILLGNLALQHPDAAQLAALAQALADITGATPGVLTEAANTVGGYVARALPQRAGPDGGLNAQAMLAEPRKAYLLCHAEPEFDCGNPVAARAALEKADLVVVLSPFKHGTAYADVLLPVAPFTETSGTFVSCEGRVQSFHGVVRPLGETRPLWKVLRVLGTLLGKPGFDVDTSEDVRDVVLEDAGDLAARLSNRVRTSIVRPTASAAATERVADVPIYFADALVRRAESLQQTADARAPKARVNRTLLDMLGIAEGAQVRVRQGRGEAVLATVVDAGVPPGVVRIAAAHASTCGLEGLTGPVQVERA